MNQRVITIRFPADFVAELKLLYPPDTAPTLYENLAKASSSPDAAQFVIEFLKAASKPSPGISRAQILRDPESTQCQERSRVLTTCEQVQSLYEWALSLKRAALETV